MRQLKYAALLASVFAFACATHSAYGPSSDDRLENETSGKRSSEGADDVADLKCDDLRKKLKESKFAERTEAETLKFYSDIYTKSRERVTKLDEAINRNPDLIYGAEGDAVKNNSEECRSTFADIASDFDRYVRSIMDPLIIQEVKGRDTVEVARVDFKVLREAIDALAPDDKDVLIGKIESAAARVKKSEGKSDDKGKQEPKGRRGGRG